MQYQAAAIAGRGEQLNASLATFEPFVEHANQLLAILASQEGAVRALVHNTGVVFNALAGRDHQLEGLIVNGERTFHAAAEASQAFAETWQRAAALRGSARSSRCGRSTASRSSPTPSWTNSGPSSASSRSCSQAAKPFAPQFNSFLTALGPLTTAAKKGLPVHLDGPQPHRPAAGKPQAGAAQPRPVPAVAGRIRARAAGVLRQPHRRHRGSRRQRQHPRPGPQPALPAHDAGLQSRRAWRSTRSGWARTARTPTSSPAPSMPSATAACRCSATARARTRPLRSAGRPTKRSPRA